MWMPIIIRRRMPDMVGNCIVGRLQVNNTLKQLMVEVIMTSRDR